MFLLLAAAAAGLCAQAAGPYNPDPASITAAMRAEKCPVGFFSTGDSQPGAWSSNPTCQACPPGQSTSASGSAVCDGES
jgi:hypothetical protein